MIYYNLVYTVINRGKILKTIKVKRNNEQQKLSFQV